MLQNHPKSILAERAPAIKLKIMKQKLTALLFVLLFVIPVQGQYFGQNKVNYKEFDFRELLTPHFKILHYDSDTEAVKKIGRYAENWYRLHFRIFADSIRKPSPIILYSNHGDFQQSVTIGGRIGVGTGGVTEGLRNRVVIPLLMTENQSNHVLGHELVHVFQYRLFKNDSTLGLQRMENVPLWMIEGLAEYLSRGRSDAHTALWMRDAVAHDDIPTLRDLSRKPDEYFPYRYGEAFWAFLAGTWGDEAILPLLKYTGRYGLQGAIDSLFEMPADTLSQLWHKALKSYYGRLNPASFAPPPGKLLVDEKNGGEMNISPNLSPDGKYLVFLSEKDVFSIDYYLADARSGKIIRKLASSVKEGHIDAFNFLESGGAWSPDSRKYAFVIYARGQNFLKIVDVESGKTLSELAVPGYASFANPAWSPDGKSIVLSAQKSMHSDLILFHPESRQVEELTQDDFAALLPSFSPDGRFIVYSTDRLSQQSRNQSARQWFNLAIYDLESGQSIDLAFFEGADNLNPLFSADGQSIYFLSNRDGFRNLYEYDIPQSKIYRLSRLFTGISGVTAPAPALSIDRSSDNLAYIYYAEKKYRIYAVKPSELEKTAVSPYDLDFYAGLLPPAPPAKNSGVSARILHFHSLPPLPDSLFRMEAYRPEFKLEYIGNTQIGVSSSAFGTGASGGVSMLFGDIIGYNKLFTALNINGDLRDAAGQFYYLNQKNRIHWGLGVSHIPIRYGSIAYRPGTDTLSGTVIPTDEYIFNTFRIFEDQINADIQYPFNRTQRLEFGASAARYYYHQIVEYYSYSLTGILLNYRREKVPVPDGFNLYRLSAAWVGDNAFFGMASPMAGYRYRIQADRFAGAQNYWGLLADLRKYFRMKPFSLAIRSFNVSRAGIGANLLINYPLFAGDPTLVHGYYSYFFSNNSSFPIQLLLGNNIHVFNAEWRLALSGPRQLALIRSRYLFTELAVFADAGLAWNAGDRIFGRFSDIDPESGRQRAPVFSTGLSLRINLFGQLVLEPYYAFALQDPQYKQGRFGLNISPGW